MSKNVLIVESPAKAKTLNKYLGKEYEVLASYGHVRDLVPKNGAVDPDNDFAMHYEVIERNAKHVAAISKALKNAETLLLATDPDREGEAISWHLYELLAQKGALKGKTVQRVVFHEITQRAVTHAVENPRDISMNLVNAQQARRALDYLVGFNVSPLLWRKVQRGLSAGRVQSPALRMIVEREREIEGFKREEYWKIQAHNQHQGQVFNAQLSVYAGEKVKQFTFTDAQSANAAIAQLTAQAQGELRVAAIEAKERKRHPAAPFITSTLQQEAARKLRYSAQRTMRIAQKLYEAGYITYMRTDSVHLAQEAIAALRSHIQSQYGKDYLPAKARSYATKSKNAQEAHEAIRPTDVALSAADIAGLGDDERKLYDLIYKRALASQMSSAILEQVSMDFWAGDEAYQFRATGTTVKFAGFMVVYTEDNDEHKEEEVAILPALEVGERICLTDISASEHHTQPPPRYSEASLIKELEEKGIGRPSTYASIIATLLDREYVEFDNRRFIPTMIGKVVNDFLTSHFQRYINYDFTAELEDKLDAVSRGELQWKPLLGDFWQQLAKNIEEKKDISREEVMGARELGVEPKTGKPVSARFGRFGPFVQIGSKDDEEKPQFASIPPDKRLETITLEEALALFKLPRLLGESAEDGEIVINIGRYGPYVRYGRKYVSLPKEEDPFTISLESALALISAKKAEEAKKYIKEIVDGEKRLQVLNGRFGPYVSDGSVNASIPKTIEPQELTLEQALALLEKAQARRANKTSKATKTTKSAKTAKKTKTASKTSATAADKKERSTQAKSSTSKKTTANKANTKTSNS